MHACRRRPRQSGVNFLAAVSYQREKERFQYFTESFLMLHRCFDSMRLHLTPFTIMSCAGGLRIDACKGNKMNHCQCGGPLFNFPHQSVYL